MAKKTGKRNSTKNKKSWVRLGYKFLLCAFLPLSVLIKDWAIKNSGWVEQVYASQWYPKFSSAWSSLFKAFDFSFVEFLIYALIIVIPISLIISMIVAIKRRHGIYTFVNWIVSLSATACILYFVFNAGWALNYYRAPLANTLGYKARLSSVDELESLCNDLIYEANTVRETITNNADGVLRLPYTYEEALRKVPVMYQELAKDYPVFAGDYCAPKPVYMSEWMNYTQITGIFIMMTMEPNVNVAVQPPLLPSTAAHEAAHQHGFAREDEANFISYLVCRETGDAYFKYSGTLLALINSMNQLYRADNERYYELRGKYSEKLNNDLIAHTEFWQQYEGPVAEKSHQVNNTYLKSNKQEDGVKSYGRMVDLLIAERRYRLGLE
jgi:hypothetical protein